VGGADEHSCLLPVAVLLSECVHTRRRSLVRSGPGGWLFGTPHSALLAIVFEVGWSHHYSATATESRMLTLSLMQMLWLNTASCRGLGMHGSEIQFAGRAGMLPPIAGVALS
jgi:hypothetical protein